MKGDRLLRKAQAYFDEHLAELQEQFPGEYVAILPSTCEVIYHHPDLGEITKYVYTLYQERPIFIHEIPDFTPLMTYEEYRERTRRQSE